MPRFCHFARRSLGLLVLPVLPVLLAGAGSRPGAAPPARATCRVADATSAALVAYVQQLLSSPAPGTVTLRQRLGLTNVHASDVALVTTAADCARAGTSLDQSAGVPASGRRVYLIKAGSTRYFAQDPNATAGEYLPLFVMDGEFVILVALLAF